MSEPTKEQWSEYIDEAREHLHASPDETDNNLKNQIRFAHSEIQGWCGTFSLENTRGRGLVMEYVRFLYNGQGEYFKPSYSNSISSFSWDLFEDGEADGDART